MLSRKSSENMFQEFYELYLKCFPEMKVSQNRFNERLDLIHTEKIIREEDGILKGYAISSNNAILLLCVAPEYQHQGFGNSLLEEAEEKIKAAGYDNVVLGHSYTYLMQGVPIKSKDFFEARGYYADWTSIDMTLDLATFSEKVIELPEYRKTIKFRLAEEKDQAQLKKAVELVNPDWVGFFDDCNSIIAVENDTILAFEILLFDNNSFYTDKRVRTGSIGCVGTIPSAREQGIGLNIVYKGITELQKNGCDEVYIEYTWLERWYGKLGFETKYQFWMGEKSWKK